MLRLAAQEPVIWEGVVAHVRAVDRVGLVVLDKDGAQGIDGVAVNPPDVYLIPPIQIVMEKFASFDD